MITESELAGVGRQSGFEQPKVHTQALLLAMQESEIGTDQRDGAKRELRLREPEIPSLLGRDRLSIQGVPLEVQHAIYDPAHVTAEGLRCNGLPP